MKAAKPVPPYFEQAYKKVSHQLRSKIEQNTLVDPSQARALWSKGFTPDKAWLYDFETYAPTDYLNDIQREMTFWINGEYSLILANKMLFHHALGTTFPQPEVLFTFEQGEVLLMSPQWMDLLQKHSQTTIYIKPMSHGGGEGILRALIGDGCILMNEQKLDWDAFVKFLERTQRRFIITQALPQHPTLNHFFPNTVNTVRMLMFRDPDTKEGVIAASALRLGTLQSGCIDSFSRGGISFDVDTPTGILGKGYKKPTNGPPQRFEVHPDTGVQMTGCKIPYWSQAIELAMRAFQHLPFLVYVGWDLVIGESQVYLLEGNHYSGVNLIQGHRPLLLNDQIKRFFRFHRILDYATPHPEALSPSETSSLC